MRHNQVDWQNKTDEEFVKAAEMQIWLSAFASNNPKAPAHRETDAAYDEAKRREKPWLYKMAWNNAFISCGYDLNEDDIIAAREPAK